MYCRNYILGPQVMSFVERVIILCPYLGESPIRGFAIYNRSNCKARNWSAEIWQIN